MKWIWKIVDLLFPRIKFRKKFFKPLSHKDSDKWADDVLQELERRYKRGK